MPATPSKSVVRPRQSSMLPLAAPVRSMPAWELVAKMRTRRSESGYGSGGSAGGSLPVTRRPRRFIVAVPWRETSESARPDARLPRRLCGHHRQADVVTESRGRSPKVVTSRRRQRRPRHRRRQGHHPGQQSFGALSRHGNRLAARRPRRTQVHAKTLAFRRSDRSPETSGSFLDVQECA